MQDMTFGQGADSRRMRRGSGRGIAALAAALLLAGMGGAAWYGWQAGWLHGPLPLSEASPSASPSATTAALAAQGNLIATNAALADATARLASLQQRLAELNQQAIAASGQASRAEALLVAFAVRRAIERGQPLGYLETSMRIRFGESQPKAVDQIVAAAQKPVTLAQLSEEFTTIAPRLTGGPANESTWDWMMRQVGGLFVVHHDDMPSPAPESRIARARTALAGQRVDLAIAEIEHLPGKDVAAEWLGHAHEWVATQRALDQIESTALSTPTVAPLATPPADVTSPDGTSPDATASDAPEGSASPAPAASASPAPKGPTKP